MLYLLEKLGKKGEILLKEEPPRFLSFLPGIGKIQPLPDKEANLYAYLRNFDAAIGIDTSEYHRLTSEEIGKLLKGNSFPHIFIDHHIDSSSFPIFSKKIYPSCAEFVAELILYQEIPLSPSIAQVLYTGIVGDTGNFRYLKNSSFETHILAAYLLKIGEFHPDEIYRKLYFSFPPQRLEALSRIWQTLKVEYSIHLAYLEYSPSMIQDLSIREEDAKEGVVNMLLEVEGIYVSALFSQTEEGYLKASFRSIGEIDVASFAKRWGEGGHKNAAGCNEKKNYLEIFPKILEDLKEF